MAARLQPGFERILGSEFETVEGPRWGRLVRETAFALRAEALVWPQA